MAKLDWEKARRRERGGRPMRESPAGKKPRGISNEQAREMAALARDVGEPYHGRGMTAADAASEIKTLRRLR